MNCGNKSWMKHISLNFPFIRVAPFKMYQDLRQNFWWTRMKREIAKYVAECDTCQREMGRYQFIRVAPFTWKLLELSNLCQFRLGNGKISVWISSWAYQILLSIMIPFGSLSTGSQRPLILFQCILNIEPRNMLRSILIGLSAYTVHPKQLYQIVVLSLWQDFGSNSKRPSELN